MRLADLARHPAVLQAHLAAPERVVEGLHCDSRRVDAATAFYALAGLRSDGHAFIADALARRTPALLVTDPGVYAGLATQPPPGVAGVLLVQPGRRVLAEVSAALNGHPAQQVRLLGVTGTNGKTTTTHLVEQLLHGLGKPCGLLGTLGERLAGHTLASDRTTPEAPDLHAFLRRCVAEGVDTATMEVSSIGIELERTHGLTFRAAAFTNLSQDHLDFHASLEAYAAAKARLFTEYATGAAVLNVDDDRGRALAQAWRARHGEAGLLTYGLEQPAALTLRGLMRAPSGRGSAPDALHGRLVWAGAEAPFRFRLLGRFNLLNLLAAVGLLLAAGEPLEAVAGAVADCTGAPGRFEPVPVPRPFSVVVDYAHTPDALENLLRAAREATSGRLTVVFGAGGERDRAKRPQMGAVCERLADAVVITDDNPRGEDPAAILDDIASGLRHPGVAARVQDRRAAILHALEQAREGDLVVIAGKGDEPYQEIAGEKRPFSDRAVVQEWAEAVRTRQDAPVQPAREAGSGG